MGEHTVCVFLPVLLLAGCVVLAAAYNPVINMEHDGEPKLEELLEHDYLLLASKNSSFRSRKMLNRYENLHATNAPPEMRTLHPLDPAMKLYLQEDDLLPTEIFGDDLLSRDRRAVGSGFEDSLAVADIMVDEQFFLANADSTNRMTTMAADLKRELLGYGVEVDEVTCTNIINEGGQTKYNFSITFTGVTDREALAYALVRMWRDQKEVGGYACITEPHICNSANVLVNAICLLCPADRPCVNGECQAFPTFANPNCFESGISEADRRLPKEDDVTSSRIVVPGDGFPYGGQYEKNIYVGDNGIVSFGSAFNPYNLRSMRSVNNKKFICVYCNDFDNRYAGGDVWYQSYPAGRPFANLQLDRAGAEIRQNTQYKRFKATWVLVVTWSNQPEFSYYSQILTLGSTFQMVLITDGTLSFVRFCFDNIRGSQSFRGHGVHGYRWGTFNNVYEMLYSRRINGNVLYRKPFMQDVRGNNGQRGIWLFKIGEIVTPNYPGMCIQWYMDNLPFRSYFRRRAFLLRNSRCPCRRRVLFWTAIFLPAPRLTSQAVYCSEMQAFFGRDTFECCYDIFGRFITRFPDAGGYSRYSRRLDPLRHQLQDSEPRDWCCRQSNLCHLYEDVRPRSSCFWNRPRRRRRFNGGDPHFTTLDGETFTFNGIGEYRLIELQDQALDEDFTFKLQCRTSQAITNGGDEVKASIYSSFAAAQVSDNLGSGRVQVELNTERTKLVVYFDDVDTTAEFDNEANFTRRMPYLTALKKSDTEIEFAFTQIDIVVGVTVISGTLAQSTVIPDTYKTKTTGLLGNFNDDTTDDFITPDGTDYDADSTDKQLFPYGKTWAVPDQDSSILHYAPHQNINTFVDNNFIPRFFEDIPPADVTAATAKCGAANKQCIYDYALTKNEDLARATTTQLEEAAADTAELENRAPLLSGTTKIDAEVGKSVSLTFEGQDDDNDTVKYVLVEGPSTGFTLNSATGVAVFTPENTEPVKIRIAANDTKASSSIIDVKIRVCQCGSNGVCDFSTPRTPSLSEDETLFQISSCICNIGYAGDTCDVNKDGCADDPCGPDRTCTDVSPTEEKATNKAFTCDGCLPGYELADQSANSKCQNINECNTTTEVNNCSAHSTCIDTLGSYDCICDEGFRLNSDNICVDIDECVEQSHNCSQNCNNTEGSYKCECYGGYKLVDGTCVEDKGSPAVCAENCPSKALCVINDTGSAVCKCENGYELSADGSTCTDINECTRHLCAQECVNTDGSYTCSCLRGFQLAPDGLDCTSCEFPYWGDNCQSMCECQGRAAACDPVQGCVCESGWTGNNCDVNINECTVNPGICGDNQQCVDNNGSYSCICEVGYEVNGTNCADVNECAENTDKLVCPEYSVCQNLIGSFVCNCNIGFKKDVDNNCTDIDECATGQAMCQHSCRNKLGSYNCYCNPGFTLKDDRKECKPDPTTPGECDGLTNLDCKHYCVVENGVPTCQCNRGYHLAADNITCLDVNECESDALNQCSLKTSCDNTPGSYTCSCPPGQKIKNDGRTCDVCDDNHWGPGCANVCSCTPLGTDTCDKIKGCVCKTGWAGDKCGADVDECGTASCQANSDCVNLPGSHECKCRTGYSESSDRSSCDEINECNDAADNVCDHYCNDTVGSYFCSCRPGFILENKGTCTDIDECSKGTHDCNQVCRNTIGSFTCECYDGYTLDPVGRKTCTPAPGAPTCGDNTCNTAVGGCRVVGGQPECFCNPGYQSNGDACNDINECSDPNTCSGGCSNTPAGSFTCSCDPGFQLASDQSSCEACPPDKWGDCTQDCDCDPSNSLACNATNGKCTCRSGWTGTDCTTDIKECDTAGICGAKGVCNEKDGTYTCTCEVGFFRNNDACSPCSATTWGDSCSNACSCDFANTASCTSTDGTCVCKTGWEGDTCTTDTNECSNTASPTVCTGSNEVCRNTDGSFACDCATGCEKSADNTACVDINECLSSTSNTCTFQCHNTVGGFSCSCPPGYSGTGNNCTANFESTIILIVLDMDNSVVDTPNSPLYKKLQEDIGKGVDDIIKSKGGDAHIRTAIKDLSKGSVVAPAELRVDKSKTTNPMGVLAAELEELANIRGISVDGNPTNMTNLTYKGIPIFENHNLCDVLRIVRSFGDNELCEVGADGLPFAKKYEEPSLNIPLIIGLSVAIFILFLLLLLCIIYVCCCRKRRESSERTPSEERDQGAFRSAFVGNLPTKGNFGASRYMMYSPHTLSDAASQVSEDSSGRGHRGRKYGTNDFNDLPRWTDDHTPSYSHLTRAPEPRTQEPSSNFSWEHLFNRLEPLRGGQFEMPRPAVSNSPNKTFRDSLA